MISTGRARLSIEPLEHFQTVPVRLDFEALSRTAKEVLVLPLIDDLGKQ